jgi:hypothetical protein
MTSGGRKASNLTLAVVAAALTGVLLGGCGGTPSVGDNLSAADLGQRQQAVAILTVMIEGEPCPEAEIQLGRRTASAFEPTTSFFVNTSMHGVSRSLAGSIAQLTLPAGEHHIVGYRCAKRAPGSINTTVVGKREGAVLGMGGTYAGSMAQFQLAPGEVVNIGHLKFTPNGIGRVKVRIEPQPAAVIDELQTSKPKLMAQMKTRLMQAAAPAG